MFIAPEKSSFRKNRRSFVFKATRPIGSYTVNDLSSFKKLPKDCKK